MRRNKNGAEVNMTLIIKRRVWTAERAVDWSRIRRSEDGNSRGTNLDNVLSNRHRASCWKTPTRQEVSRRLKMLEHLRFMSLIDPSLIDHPPVSPTVLSSQGPEGADVCVFLFPSSSLICCVAFRRCQEIKPLSHCCCCWDFSVIS